MKTENPRYNILLKEMEFIQDSVKNLDDLIFKTQNFALIIWGGAIYLLVDKAKGFGVGESYLLIIASMLIPCAFWGAHYYWQKFLLIISDRERKISSFINSSDFNEWLNNPEDIRFPVYDPVGWIYTLQIYGQSNVEPASEPTEQSYKNEYLVDYARHKTFKVMFYKGAKFYYPLMIAISLILGLWIK